jgi:hypothetical protein
VFNIQTYFGQAATSDELRQVWSKQAQKAA